MSPPAPRVPSSGAEAAMRQPMPASSSVPQPQAAPTIRLATFADVVALAAEKRDLPIKAALENDVRLVRIEDGRLEIALEPQAQRSLAQDLSRKLEQWTGRRWTIAVSNTAGQPTLRAQALAQRNELESAVQADPRVQAVFETWPGAKIENVRRTVRPPAEADLPLPDPLDDDDDDL
jgi:DNA polymerase-3 subunit gamma/tau